MVDEKTWEEFRKTGLVLIINQILHIFGWAIVFDVGDDGTVKNVFPARVKFRGFDNNSVEESYRKVSKYMVENAEKLLEEAKD